MTETVRIGNYEIRKNNVYYYNAELFKKFDSLTRSVRQKRIHYPNDPLLLAINSRGGSMFIEFYLHRLEDNGIITLGYNLVASEAVSLMQVGEKRYSHRSTRFFMHRPVISENGFLRNVTEEELGKSMSFIGRNIIVERTGISFEKQNERYDKGLWMTSSDAKKEGFIDEIVDVPEGLELALRRIPRGSIGFLKPNY